MKNRFYIIRHGETDDSQNNIVQGHCQTPLNKKGISTCKKIGRYMALYLEITKIITSDLRRCTETSEIIIKETNESISYIKTEQLREINLGIFEGKHINILNDYRSNAEDYNAVIPPAGESINEMTCRINKWLSNNINYLNNSLIVTHKGPISVILSSSINNLNSEEKNDALKHGRIVCLEILPNLLTKIIEIIKI